MKENKNMIRRILLVCLFIICGVNAQAQKEDVVRELEHYGFENIRIANRSDTIYIAYENIAYRNEIDGLLSVFKVLISSQIEKEVVLILLDKKVPEVAIRIPENIMKEAILAGKFQKSAIDKLSFKTNANEIYKDIKKSKQYASSAGRVDVVVYPHFKIQNVTFNKIWETQIGLDPAIQMQLWKGGCFTGQVKIPFYNDIMENEGSYFRTGIIALTQNFALPKGWQMHLGAGLFSNNRQGLTGSVRYTTPSGNIETTLNLGYTGAIYWDNGKCTVYNWSKLNALGSVSYFSDWQGIELKLQGGRYVYGDYGVRFDIIRRFKNVGIGLFAAYSGSDGTGGFNFTVPIGLRYYKRKGYFRIMPANYFVFEFNEKTGGRYSRQRNGRSFTDSPGINLIEDCFNPQYLRNGLKIAL